ncbi:hypothetical protein LTR10_019995 [Elasticomyces elasticus]|uniref:MmgE/PrpD family protein n=1 Tax=Exophiala sideris TaxID=1016849 RepID=A0ABR0IYA4_9EURO|nr:hypothetical protein LTR10_019995 [Elasticomyces elasticus]KAK5022460.1 hypothetical protein LTS07_010120 [Exophiala sideris]KAK5027180.1 hypothetical protein LTR13_009575 [Exophiala sideris]KAK5051314.1 hypothetical protein LTR69_010340 [Exophiala sideris]KAK5177720.1 hypothetical protein LTR44_009695 [Eurotiomycetes sp. CCFEE 6388]
MSNDVDHTLRLATFLSRLKFEDLQPDVINQAKLSILNSLGCGIGSSLSPPAIKVSSAVLRPDESCLDATIIGRSQRARLEDAILINGVALTTADYDDTHLKTVVHPSGTPLAALLSWAEVKHLSGKDFILAFVCGVEAQCAVANAISPSHYQHGWHITGTTGSFGAAAAIAKALSLNPHKFAAALGHAASMAGGIRAMFGTDTKTLHMGRAAQNGFLAAQLAESEFDSCPRAIESWMKLVSDNVTEKDLSALAAGGPFELLDNTFKPYPCGIVIHPLIDGCLNEHEFLRHRNMVASLQETLEVVEVVVNPQCVRLCSIRHPRSGLETIFSLYHGCAVALVYGRAGPAELSDAACNDSIIRSIRDKIQVTTDQSVADDAAKLKFRYSSKSVSTDAAILEDHEVFIVHATGSLAKPMSAQQVEDKFLDQSKAIIGAGKSSDIIKLCRSLEDVADMSELGALLTPS